MKLAYSQSGTFEQLYCVTGNVSAPTHEETIVRSRKNAGLAIVQMVAVIGELLV
jgi:hypothetical protein